MFPWPAYVVHSGSYRKNHFCVRELQKFVVLNPYRITINAIKYRNYDFLFDFKVSCGVWPRLIHLSLSIFRSLFQSCDCSHSLNVVPSIYSFVYSVRNKTKGKNFDKMFMFYLVFVYLLDFSSESRTFFFTFKSATSSTSLPLHT